MTLAARLAVVAIVLAGGWWFRGGFGDVGAALATAGWMGLAGITLWHLMPMALCGLAWGSLLPDRRPWLFITCRWVRDGVGELAGFLPLSGELASARLLARRGGLRASLAGALTVVDLTGEVIAQFLFSLLGVGLWLWRHPSAEVVRWGLIGLAISLPVLAIFLLVQRSSAMRFLETLPARLMPKLWQAPEEEAGMRAAIHALHADRGRAVQAVALHFAAWLIACGEAWLALRLLGHAVTVADAVALESIIFAIRSAAFVIPAAIGIQEGGYVLVGAALGLPADVALAVSLLKRGREVALGVPALLAWHWLEGKK